MSSSPITSWQLEEEKVEVVTDFLFLGSKITADGDWSLETWRRLWLGRKVITKLDSVLRSREIILRAKICIVMAVVLPMVMYSCESLTIKRQNTEELMPSNYGAQEDSWQSLGQQKDQTSQS